MQHCQINLALLFMKMYNNYSTRNTSSQSNLGKIVGKDSHLLSRLTKGLLIQMHTNIYTVHYVMCTKMDVIFLISQITSQLGRLIDVLASGARWLLLNQETGYGRLEGERMQP